MPPVSAVLLYRFASCLLPHEILNRIACLPEANTPFVWRTASAVSRNSCAECTSIRIVWRANTRWPMPCFAKNKKSEEKKQKKKLLLPWETKTTSDGQRANGDEQSPQNDWWFNKYMAFFIQPWPFSLQRNNNRRQQQQRKNCNNISKLNSSSLVGGAAALSMSLVVIRPNYIVRVEFNLNM